MAYRRIRTSRKREEPTPSHIFTDHDWVRNNEEALIEQYGECYMIVYHERVLGVGKTREEAVQNAERKLPAEMGEIQVMVERIGRHFGIARVYSDDRTK